MKNFQPKLFIGIGETNAYFTLRETYVKVTHIPGEGPSGNAVVNGVYQGQVREEIASFHHFNLSQDAAEAVAKAKEISITMGLPFFCKQETIEADMREIKKRTADQIATAHRRAQMTIAMDQAHYENRRRECESNYIKAFEEFGRYMQSGAHAGTHVSHLPKSYCVWINDNSEKFEPWSFMAYLHKVIMTDYPELVPAKLNVRDGFFGEVKKRYTLNLEVFEAFSFEGFYGRTHITKMVDADGICFVVMSGAFSAELGDKLTVKATVKRHETYKGQDQTLIQRVKVQ